MMGDSSSVGGGQQGENIIHLPGPKVAETIYHGSSRLILAGEEIVISHEDSGLSLLISLGPRGRHFLLYLDNQGNTQTDLDPTLTYAIQEDMSARDPNYPSRYGALTLYTCLPNGRVIGKIKLNDSVEGTAFMGNGLRLTPTDEGFYLQNRTGRDMAIEDLNNHPEILGIIGLQEGEKFHGIEVTALNIQTLNFLLSNGFLSGRLSSMFYSPDGESVYSLIRLVEVFHLKVRKVGHVCVIDQNGNLQYVKFTPNEGHKIDITSSMTKGAVTLQVDGINIALGEELYLQYEGKIIYLGKVIDGYVELLRSKER